MVVCWAREPPPTTTLISITLLLRGRGISLGWMEHTLGVEEHTLGVEEWNLVKYVNNGGEYSCMLMWYIRIIIAWEILQKRKHI